MRRPPLLLLLLPLALAVDVTVPTARGTGHRVEVRTDAGGVRVHT
jgi:hypothetical protein